MNADRPSATALIVAAGLAALAHDPLLGQFVSPEAARLGAAAATASASPLRFAVPQLTRPGVRAAIGAVEHAILPGILLHYALRKRVIGEWARRAIADGIGQVVILGGGYDALALTLAREYPVLRVIEVDHPATQEAKRRALAALGPHPPGLTLLPADLTAISLVALLGTCPAYDSSRPALFVAEGLLIYFPPCDVATIFSAIHDVSVPGSRFAFTAMLPRADGTIGFIGSSPLLDRWLAWRGEPFRWALSWSALPLFLFTHSFSPREIVTTAMLRHRYLASPDLVNAPLAVGEWLCYAERVDV